MSNPWPSDRKQLVAQLWAEGLSAAQIAARLGGDVTRNAVIGQVTRLNLPRRKPFLLNWRQLYASRQLTPEQKAAHNANRRARRAAKANGVSLAPISGNGHREPPRTFKPVPAPSCGPGVPIIEATGCRYAMTEHSPHRFCNAPCGHGSSWCEFHSAIVWRRV